MRRAVAAEPQLRRRGRGNEADPLIPCLSLIDLAPDPWLQLQPWHLQE